MHDQICAFFFGRISNRFQKAIQVLKMTPLFNGANSWDTSIFQLSCQKRDKNHQPIHFLPMHLLHSHKIHTIPSLSILRASSCKRGKFQCNVNYLHSQELSWAADYLVQNVVISPFSDRLDLFCLSMGWHRIPFASFSSLVGVLGHNRQPPVNIVSLCRIPQWLRGLENVTSTSIWVCRERVTFE